MKPIKSKDKPEALSLRDLEFLRKLKIEDIQLQEELFAHGVLSRRVLRPCQEGDGILAWGDLPQEEVKKAFREVIQKKALSFFIPASGAASRLFGFLQKDFQSKEAKQFFDQLYDIPLAASLQAHFKAKGLSLSQLLENGETQKIVDALFEEGGYGRLPKALLPFHRQGKNYLTALEENLKEASSFGSVPVHFTMEPRVRERFQSFLEDKSLDSPSVSFSWQEPSTQTLAQEASGAWLRKKDQLVLRPGGHGALLKNLAAIHSAYVYLRNIDNISHAWHRKLYRPYRQSLVGMAHWLQKKGAQYLMQLKANPTQTLLKQAWAFGKKFFGWVPVEGDFDQQIKSIIKKLSRPLRVCGMVKTSGQVGGGPFWVEGSEGPSLQIMEGAELVDQDPALLSPANYFNPVEIVACLQDPEGKNYALEDFVEKKAWILGQKDHEGRSIQTLERPGLWNGSMAHWNSCFVAFPKESFTPVKTVLDLLKPEHRVKNI